MDPTAEADDDNSPTGCIAFFFELIIRKLIEKTPEYMYFVLAAEG